MSEQGIKMAESMREFNRKVQSGEIESPEDWYVRHPENPSLLKKVRNLDEAPVSEEEKYTPEELEAFKKQFLDENKDKNDVEVQEFEVKD